MKESQQSDAIFSLTNMKRNSSLTRKLQTWTGMQMTVMLMKSSAQNSKTKWMFKKNTIFSNMKKSQQSAMLDGVDGSVD